LQCCKLIPKPEIIIEMETNRRDFIKTMGVATMCACTGIGVSGCSMFMGVSDTPVIPEKNFHLSDQKLILDLTRTDCLKEAGTAGKLTLQQAEEEIKIIIVHHEPGQYKAFADKCTHGGRELNYQQKEALLQCSSFGHSTFRLENGSVIKGPAEDALTLFPTEINDDMLWVML
jgi:cytochrome b6-f complex iron-sulfur subunit